jgi:hypothetical protein
LIKAEKRRGVRRQERRGIRDEDSKMGLRSLSHKVLELVDKLRSTTYGNVAK